MPVGLFSCAHGEGLMFDFYVLDTIWAFQRPGPDDGCILDDEENKPVWPTWAVGILSGVRDVETYNHGHPSLRSLKGVLL